MSGNEYNNYTKRAKQLLHEQHLRCDYYASICSTTFKLCKEGVVRVEGVVDRKPKITWLRREYSIYIRRAPLTDILLNHLFA